ncbi:HNH endonuclease [Bacillus mycoides]|uniref:HNH endonuclease n=1 Tax=Bacillus mycoides TaxID=1405 RepID=UPI000BF11026|nr:HNH endonuclease [Bacillus mycoides]PEK86904.1 hypothetical protein CN600_28765 [Bacillus mycoides]
MSRKYPIDKACIKKLHSEYHCSTTSEFSKILGVTRQYISSIALSTPKRKPKEQWDDTLTENERKEVFAMIQNRAFTYQADKTLIRIYKHIKNVKQFAIFLKKNDILKCIFTLPSDILNELITYQFHEMDERDFCIMKEIEGRGIPKGNIIHLDPDDNLIKMLINRLQASEWSSRKEYINFLGWTYIDANTISIDELRQKVLPYIDQDGYFRMRKEDEGYYNLKNTFSRRGFRSTEAWVTYLGFKYKRTRNMSTEEKYKERLKCYIVFENKVYIQSISNQGFYNLLFFYGRRKDMTINELLTYLGYDRLYKEELPTGFTPYIEQPPHYSCTMIEDFQELLDNLIIDEKTKELFLQPEEQLYKELIAFAATQNKTILELLKEWGYILSKQKLFLTASLTADQQSLLRNLKLVQRELETTLTLQEQFNRSKQLVREIKRLYNYRCQICTHNHNEETIPYIIKSDGSHYVEVHHIIQLSESDFIENEFNLDSYENVICVCPHHHRVLHYHNGGYDKLIANKNGDLYFVSKQGDKLKIHHNLHIQPIESLMLETT